MHAGSFIDLWMDCNVCYFFVLTRITEILVYKRLCSFHPFQRLGTKPSFSGVKKSINCKENKLSNIVVNTIA